MFFCSCLRIFVSISLVCFCGFSFLARSRKLCYSVSNRALVSVSSMCACGGVIPLMPRMTRSCSGGARCSRSCSGGGTLAAPAEWVEGWECRYVNGAGTVADWTAYSWLSGDAISRGKDGGGRRAWAYCSGLHRAQTNRSPPPSARG